MTYTANSRAQGERSAEFVMFSGPGLPHGARIGLSTETLSRLVILQNQARSLVDAMRLVEAHMSGAAPFYGLFMMEHVYDEAAGRLYRARIGVDAASGFTTVSKIEPGRPGARTVDGREGHGLNAAFFKEWEQFERISIILHASIPPGAPQGVAACLPPA